MVTPKRINSSVINAFKYLFVADSLAMPVHWYYRISDILSAFPGGVQKLEKAPSFHPGSIMSLHSKNSGGRKYKSNKNSKTIVGDVILKGREKFWNQSNVHYHHEMQAGDMTLNAYCVRVLLQSYIKNEGKYSLNHYLKSYITMMTSDKPQHKDTYAESYHRGFFANLVQGNDLNNCGAITHDTASIGGLVSIGPLTALLYLSGLSKDEITDTCLAFLHTTHPNESLSHICKHYILLVIKLLKLTKEGSSQDVLIETAQNSMALDFARLDFDRVEDSSIVGGRFSSACYITDSWPSVLFLCIKYYNRPAQALIANTNLGGDNVHRGAVMGFILGLTNVESDQNQQVENWFSQLKYQEDTLAEIKESVFVAINP